MTEKRVTSVLGGGEYSWLENWAKIPPTEASRTGWAHHGIIASEGVVITFHQGDRRVLVFDGSGNLVRSWQTDLVEGHGMTLVREGGEDYLWMADNGSKRRPDLNYEYPSDAISTSGQVVKMDLDGRIVTRLPKPEMEPYEKVRYAPTSIAVHEERFGGNGDIWVSDGYGANLVHRFDRNGKLAGSLDGTEGAGRFSTPHCVFIDRRRSEPELYVADRANRRIQVFDLRGNYRRVFGSDSLSSPSGFAVHGGLLFVAELRARVAVFGIDDKPFGYIGENEKVCDNPGWPNSKDASGRVVRTDKLEPGRFNSPHGITTDVSGNIYVAEWLIGGRITKLGKVPDSGEKERQIPTASP